MMLTLKEKIYEKIIKLMKYIEPAKKLCLFIPQRNDLCMLEIFNTNITRQFFDNKIAFAIF